MSGKITVQGTKKVELDISNSEIARAVKQWTCKKYFNDEIDDAGMDWYTANGKVYIGSQDWELSDHPNIVALVDAANILRYGKKMTIEIVKIRCVARFVQWGHQYSKEFTGYTEEEITDQINEEVERNNVTYVSSKNI